MFESFFGDLHPHDFKRSTSGKVSRNIPPPPFVVIPMSPHSGEPCVPTVAVGDTVKMGQKIGDSKEWSSAPVHASVSGKVAAIEPKLLSDGTKAMSVIIENDGLDTLSEEISPHRPEEIVNPEVLCEIVREAGIIGMGGGLSTAASKIKASIGKVDTLIINGAECEPYITSDYRVMVEHPYELIEGIRILKRAFGLPFACLGIEKNKHYAISFLGSRCGSDIKIFALKTAFPQGEEKQIVKAVARREIPPGGSSLSVRTVVFNVNTVYAIYRAVYEGMPSIERIVTVSGEAATTPSNINCRIGTPVEYVFESTGGFNQEPHKILAGGPMTGTALYDLSVPVTKDTNALLAMTKRLDKDAQNPTCIRCGRCAEVCPMRLMPMYIRIYQERGDLENLVKFHVSDCMECGLCTYVCPGRIYLTQACRLGKAKIDAGRKIAVRRKDVAVKNEL